MTVNFTGNKLFLALSIFVERRLLVVLRDLPRGVEEPMPLQQPCRETSSLVRIHFIIVMIRWSGLAPWELEFPFPGSLTSLPS